MYFVFYVDHIGNHFSNFPPKFVESDQPNSVSAILISSNKMKSLEPTISLFKRLTGITLTRNDVTIVQMPSFYHEIVVHVAFRAFPIDRT
jgi:hypothetical protein